MADAVMPVYHDIKLVADATDPNKVGGALLESQAGASGVDRPQAVGASGSVTVSASFGGGFIALHDELTALGLKFECKVGNTYFDGDEVPVQGIDTGPATNLAAGTVATWSNPAPGIGATCTVTEQLDGSGLSGGREEATDEEYRILWNQEKQARPASGNDGEIQELVEDTAGMSVEKAFTYPGIFAPGTSAFVFTLKPSTTGSSRLPNPTQIAAALAHVVGSMPADEGIFAATLLAQDVDCVFKILWDPDGAGWNDMVIWPYYFANPGQAVIVDTAASATSFVLKTQNGVYTGPVGDPVAGQSIAFYDRAFGQFRKKRILSVVGGGPWTITVDTSNGVSDESYTPIVGQRAMPWSESLQDIVTPVAEKFNAMGPGEQVAVFFDDGTRQRRTPRSPRDWPSVLTTKRLEDSFDEVDSVFDVTIQEPTLPLATTVGTQGVDSYLMELGYLSVFPL